MASLTREKADEICNQIRANPDALFGQKYWQCRHACAIQIQTQQKSDKWETRFLAIAKFRVFLLHGKSASSLKLEKSFNVLALRHLELLQQEQLLQIGWEDRAGGARQNSPSTVMHLLARMPDESKPRELALELLATLKHYFPEVQKSLNKLFSTLGPPSLLSEFPTLPLATPELPCKNFRRSYVAYCDWMEQPFRDEVIWDIERIYFYHGLHELDLNDFSHLPTKDQQTLIGSIQFSSFFTGISADGLRLQPEQTDALLLLIRRSHSLKSIQLTRCTVPRDFLQQFASALALNMNLPLERLRLAGMVLDDRKGIAQFAALLPQLPFLHSLSLPECALNEKSALVLLHGLHHGIGLAKESAQAEDGDGTKRRHGFQLKALNLSGNILGNGTELSEQLANLLALNNGAIRMLDLSGTAVQLDRLWAALKLGGLSLEVLRLGGCQCAQTKRKNSGKDSAQVARELFATLRGLKELNLTGINLNAELLQGILMGISANQNMPESSLHLCLDNCIVGSAQCIAVLEKQLPLCPTIRTLSLRDNSLEHETFRLLTAIGQMTGIRAIDLGGANFFGLKSNKKHAQMLNGILTEVVKLVNDPQQDAPELCLSDTRLGSHLGVLLNALGLSRTLKRLDLSNCELGPGGARLLGKSLQLNQSIQHLSLDRNQIGPDGFVELARALRLNSTLLHLQMPSSDLADSMLAFARSPVERGRIMLVWAEIEQALNRNREMDVVGPTQRQLAMRTMHSLNNSADRYEVNGPQASEVKKAAFHKLGKLVVQMGEETDSEEENVQNGSTMEEGKRTRVVDQLAERIEQMALEKSKQFLHNFLDRLSSQEGVEMKVDGSNNQKLANGFGANGGADAQEQLAEQLRQQLAALTEHYTNEFAWNHLFTQMDQLLCAPESQGCFQLLERQTKAVTTNGTTRRGILIRNGGAALTASNYRPVSAIMAEERQAQQQNGSSLDLMTRSVMGDFAAFTVADSVEGDGIGKEEAGRKLLHLAKGRPKPARLNRRAAEIKGIAEEKDEAEEVADTPCTSAAVAPTKSAALLPPESNSLLLEQSLEQSPLMRQQRLKHAQQQLEEDEKHEEAGEERVSIELPATSPPPLPKKGTREGSTPPKLPPKPSPNSNAEDLLRNKKTRVLPAVTTSATEGDNEEEC